MNHDFLASSGAPQRFLSVVAFANEEWQAVGSNHIWPPGVADVKIVVAFESRMPLAFDIIRIKNFAFDSLYILLNMYVYGLLD